MRASSSCGLLAVGVVCVLIAACAPPPSPETSADSFDSGTPVAVATEALSGCTSQTYGGHDYLFCTNDKNWDNARTDCQSAGMELVRINDSAENDFVRGKLALLGSAWIGANDKTAEGNWLWSVDGTQFWSGTWAGNAVGGLYSKWALLQPDDLLSQDCGRFQQVDGTWSDDSCGLVLDYVCESIPAPPPPTSGSADTGCWDAAGLQTGAPWPMRGLCPLRRGNGKFIGSQSNTVNWVYATGGAIRSSAAVGADGAVYFGSDDTYVYAIKSDGTLKWRYKTGNKVRSSPTIGNSGALYVGSDDGYLYALNLTNGGLVWRTATNAAIESSPSVASDGTIYVGSDSKYLYALSPGNGAILWNYQTQGNIDSSPARAPDGTIYVGSDDHFLYALKPDLGLTAAQRLRWKVDLGSDINAIPAVGPAPDNAVYVRTQVGKVYKLNPANGQTLASYNGPADLDTDSSPAVALDGSVYVGIAHAVYAFTANLGLKWTFPILNDVKSSPAIGADGTVYVGADDQRVYALKPTDGSVIWSLQSLGLLAYFRPTPSIGKNGTIYIGGDDKKLYSIGTFACDATHPCGNAMGPCSSNSGCGAGLVCGRGVSARFGLPDDFGVCWDPRDCATLTPTSCGGFRSLCGTCCTPSCGSGAGAADGCGGTCQACVSGADSDGDGIADCSERTDQDSWTDPLIFNGVIGQRGNSCQSTPTCAQIDTAAEINTCFSSIETDRLRSGWDFNTTDKNICGTGFNYQLPWQGCGQNFDVRYTGTIRLQQSGIHCFAVKGLSSNQCGALLFNLSTTAVTTGAPAVCYNLPAGLYPIDWFYITTSTTSNELHVDYCFGGTSNCTPTQAIPASMLRPSADATGRICGPDTLCTELCLCSEGQVCDPAHPFCVDGLVCRTGVGNQYGQPASTPVCAPPPCGNGVLDSGEVCDPGLTPFCAADCSAESAPTVCNTDSDCALGQSCGLGNGALLGQDPQRSFCWPTHPCSTAPNQSCGSSTAACGACACTPQCANKTCGDDPSDGCGGFCAGLCQARQEGCKANSECPTGYVCGVGVGSRFGKAAGTNVCMPSSCNDYLPSRMQCGSVSAPCGLCPIDPAVILADTTCNPGCGNGTFCSTGGQCLPKSAVVAPPNLAAAAPQTPTAGVGKIPASFAVTQQGSAAYTIPLEVPPGRAGMEPNLALQYDSAAGDGFVGHGWSLSGLPAITRCAKTFATDSESAAPRGDASDVFCLGRDRLVAVNGSTYGGDGAEYRTEIDTFTKVISYGPTTANDGSYAGPSYFKAWTKEGRILTFGTGVGSRRTAGNVAVAWYVNLFEDHSGNSMDVVYEQPTRTVFIDDHWHTRTDVLESRPQAIYYTYSGNKSATRKVLFSYDNTKVNLTPRKFIAGAAMNFSSPLLDIEMFVEGQRARNYQLTTRPIGATWVLDSVQLCTVSGGVDTCIPQTTFTYDETGADLSAPTGNEASLAFSSGKKRDRILDVETTVFDFDDDGDDDLLQITPTDDHGGRSSLLRLSTMRHLQSGDSGRFFDNYTPVVTDFAGEGVDLSRALAQCHSFKAFDFDGDGRDDLYAECQQVHGLPGKAPRYLFVSTGGPTSGGGFTDPGFKAYMIDDASPYMKSNPPMFTGLIDLDDDGRLDYVLLYSVQSAPYELAWRRNLGPSGTTPFGPLQVLRTAWGYSVVDDDGDGTTDLVLLPDNSGLNGPAARVYIDPTGTLQLRPAITIPPNAVGLQKIEQKIPGMLDVNGDGLPDEFSWTPLYLESAPNAYFTIQLAGAGPTFSSWSPNIATSVYTQTDSFGFIELLRPEVFAMDRDNDGRQELYWAPAPPASPQNGLFWKEQKPFGDDGGPWTSADSAIPIVHGGPWASEFLQSDPQLFRQWQDWQKPTVMDVNGDGVKDLVTRNGDEQNPYLEVRFAQSRTRLKLTGVHDGMFGRMGIEYEVASLGTKTRAYTPGTSCAYPQRCLARTPYPVVAAYTTDGEGGPFRNPASPADTSLSRRFEYTYADGRMDLLGRGFLGYTQRTVKEVVAVGPGTWNTLSTTDYFYDLTRFDQAHRIYWKASQPVLTQTVVTTQGNELTGGAPTRHVDITLANWELNTSESGLPYVAVESTTRIQSEGQSAATISEVSERTSSYDGFGNPLHKQIMWKEGNERIDDITYTYETRETRPDLIAQWLVSLPKQVDIFGLPQGDTSPSTEKHVRITADNYNSRGLPEHVTRSGAVGGGAPLDRTVSDLDYDAYGNVSQLTVSDAVANAGATAPPRVTKLTYDYEGYFPIRIENGVHLAATLPGTAVWHDPRNGKLGYLQDPSGNWYGFAYDGLERLQWSRDADGRATYVTYARGTQANGPLEVSVSSTGRPDVTTEYNSFGLPTLRRESRMPGQVTWQEFGYDDFGRLSAEGVVHFAGTSSPGATFYKYDELGRLIQQDYPWQEADGTSATGTVLHMYASLAHATANTSVSNWLALATKATRVHLVQDAGGFRTAQTLDMRGNVAATIDAKGNASVYTYGAFDHLLDIDFDGLHTEFLSDEVGSLGQYQDRNRGTYRYLRNGFGDVDRFIRNPGTSSEQVSTYAYDGLGREISSTTPEGTYTWTWDGDGTLASQIGRLVSESVSSASIGNSGTTYEYDGIGGKLSAVRRQIRGEAFDTTVSYNTQGLLDTVTYPSDSPLQRVKYSYNLYGEITSVSDPDHASDPAFFTLGTVDAFGGVAQGGYGNGVQVTRSREVRTGLLHLAQAVKGTDVIQSEGYGYNERGLLSYRGTPDFSFGFIFIYDELGRVGAQYNTLGSQPVGYVYDARGNVTQSPVVGTLYYGGGALTADQVASTSDGRAFGYDSHGNQSLRGMPDGSAQLMSYSSFDLPIELSEVSGGSISNVTRFEYDARGQRVVRELTSGPTTETMIYAGDLYRRNARTAVGTEATAVVPLPDGSTLEVTTGSSGRQLHYLHVDLQGSVAAITDGNGSRLESRTFSPFGLRDQASWPTNVTAGYTGQEQERAQALINMRGRMYDPAIGRFLSTDPVMQGAFHTQGLNPYSYALNSPGNLVDPSGFDGEAPDGTGGTNVCTDCSFPDDVITVQRGAAPTPAPEGAAPPPEPPAPPPPPDGPNTPTGGSTDEDGPLSALPDTTGGGAAAGSGAPAPLVPSRPADESKVICAQSGCTFDRSGGAREQGGFDALGPEFVVKDTRKSLLLDTLVTVGTAPLEAVRLGMLLERVPAAARVLPAVSRVARLTQEAVEHIALRHFPTSGARGAGKFATTSLRALRELINEAVEKGSVRPNTLNRPGHIFEFNFGKNIGTNIAGKPSSSLRVVVVDGVVKTAFPF